MLWSSSLNSGTPSIIWVPSITDQQATIMTPLTWSMKHYQRLKTTDEKSSVVTLVNSEELECMSKNIYFEAAMESTAGKLAVAQVTMNRVRSTHYPNTVCKVITQGRHYKNGFPVKDRCQFSWYCDGKGDEPREESRLWNDTQELAKYVLLRQDELPDITDGALHYHADYITAPRWAGRKHKTAKIDTHIFYRPRTLRM